MQEGETCDYSAKPLFTFDRLARDHDINSDEWDRNYKNPSADTDRRFVEAADRTGDALSMVGSRLAQAYNNFVRDPVESFLQGESPMPAHAGMRRYETDRGRGESLPSMMFSEAYNNIREGYGAFVEAASPHFTNRETPHVGNNPSHYPHGHNPHGHNPHGHNPYSPRHSHTTVDYGHGVAHNMGGGMN
eukprot:3448290-Prymnesium_polylepis.1